MRHCIGLNNVLFQDQWEVIIFLQRRYTCTSNKFYRRGSNAQGACAANLRSLIRIYRYSNPIFKTMKALKQKAKGLYQFLLSLASSISFWPCLKYSSTFCSQIQFAFHPYIQKLAPDIISGIPNAKLVYLVILGQFNW